MCAYFLATMPLLRYFKPIKDDSSNVCKGAIFVVLGASEKEAIEVAAESVLRLRALKIWWVKIKSLVCRERQDPHLLLRWPAWK